MSLPIVIDCDPGIDDAIALLVAFASPELEILGITTVAGNVPLSLTAQNARKICELADRSALPVYAGCPRPLVRPLATADDIHGKTGLDGATFPDPQMPLQSQHAVSFLIETLMRSSDPITLAMLGPLTNLAVALIQEPQIASKIKDVVIMGGAIGDGNITPVAEFNFYVDPHAAHVVFTSGLPITLIPLDITHQVLTTADRLKQLRAINSPVSNTAADLLAFYGSTEARFAGIGNPLHDPCVIAYLLQPDLFTIQPCFAAIEISSELTIGQSVVDVYGVTGKPANMQRVQTVKADQVYDLLIDRLAQL